ncbi:MAG: amidoligase family protein [Firmicutes bacterium]|nr:amidoligase family protein [Bacillota bacterium]
MTNRAFGIEIEAYGVSQFELEDRLRQAGIQVRVEGYNHSTREHWKIVSDGSIQGPDSFELVSPPLSGEEGLNQIRTVCRVLDEVGAKVNKSCGFHVHHSAADLTPKALQALIGLYTRFQGALDEIVAKSRRGNNNTYCRALSNELYYRALRRDDLQGIVCCQDSRYYKLNLQAYLRHGTIEIRHHQGTVNADKIINWIRLTQAIVEAAVRLNHSKLSLDNHTGRLDHDRWHFWNTVKKVLDAGEFEELRAYYGQRRKELAAAA